MLASRDPVLAGLIATGGPIRIGRRTGSHFGGLVEAIVYQQLAGAAARAIHGRLVAALDDDVRPEAPLRARDLPWLGAIVLFGGILGPALLMSGLTLTPASSGTLLLNTEGLATMALAWLVFRENVDPRIFLGAMAILAGAVLLSWPAGESTSPHLD